MEDAEGFDFIVTYPCFILMKTETTPVVIDVDGDIALCLFTDSDNLCRFHARHAAEIWQGRSGLPHLIAAQCQDKTTLLAVLEALCPDFVVNKSVRVALDPTFGRGALSVRISDFVGIVERQRH